VPRVDVPVILVTGATGVGKSQVVSELSRLLDQKGIEHTRLDWDTLTTGPVARQPVFVVEALASAWHVHRRAGAVRLLLAGSLERREMLSEVFTAIEGARVRAFCLIAPPQEIAARLRYRERGGLSERIFVRDIAADLRVYDGLRAELESVDTVGRTATEVAIEVLHGSGWATTPAERPRKLAASGPPLSRDSCPICTQGYPNDVLLELEASWVTAHRRAPLPGYVCVVSKVHVVEPFELPLKERARFWEELTRTAQGVAEATKPAKLNYEIHGNTVPHLHVHIYPRYPGDPFEGRPIDASRNAPFVRSDADLERLRAAITEAHPESESGT
jgi:diadenosine tetraphosphate (Ap4A) HIT family hydrolase